MNPFVNQNITLNLDVVVVDDVSMRQSKLHREAGVGGEGPSHQEVLKRFDKILSNMIRYDKW